MIQIFIPDQILFRRNTVLAVPVSSALLLTGSIYSFLMLLRHVNQCIVISKVGSPFLKITSANLRLFLQQWLLFLGQARILLRLVGSGAFFFEVPRQNEAAIASVFMCAETSHVFFLDFPVPLVTVAVAGRKKKILIITSHNLSLLQRVAFQICKLRKPDPYKGKGVRFFYQKFSLKTGKKKFV